MVKICPICQGTRVGCPTCNAPPRRLLPKSDIYKGKLLYRKYTMMFYGAPIWEVQGIDISKWNGNMNFAITKTRCQYVNIRYGYGLQWKDPNLDIFYTNARIQDMPVGAYWYLYDNQDPIQTADSFAELIASHPIQLDAHGDLEQTYLSPSQTLEWMITFENRLQSKINKLNVPYSSKGFWDTGIARSSRWTTRRIWDANWTTRDYPVVPIDWTFKQGDQWQHSADGNKKAIEYGSSGGDPDMDLNRYYGTVIQFNLQYGTHIKSIGEVVPPPIPPTPPLPGQLPEYVIINTGELAIHNSPDAVQTNIIGHALMNTKWYPSELVTKNGISWYRLGKNEYISKNYTRLL